MNRPTRQLHLYDVGVTWKDRRATEAQLWLKRPWLAWAYSVAASAVINGAGHLQHDGWDGFVSNADAFLQATAVTGAVLAVIIFGWRFFKLRQIRRSH